MVNVRDQILKKILDNMTVNPEGNIQWQGDQSTEYNRYLSLLLSDLMLDNHVQSKLNSLRYYFTSENNLIFIGNELQPVFKEMKQENKTAFADFKEKLDLMLQKIEKGSKAAKFELYYPINIRNEEKVDMLTFKEVSIELKDYDEIKDLFEVDRLKIVLRIEKFTKSKYKYLKVTLWARNQNYAQVISAKYVNLILGFIAYSQNYYSSTIRFMGIPEELTQLKPNYIFAFKEGAYEGYFYFEDKSDDKKTYDLSNEDIKNLNEFVKQFNSSDNKIQDILYKAISLYYQGLTEKKDKLLILKLLDFS